MGRARDRAQRAGRVELQLELGFPVRGGARPGAGRKPKRARAGMPHEQRGAISRHHPVHVTLGLEPGLPTLRDEQTFAVVTRALAAICDRPGMLVNHYSVMPDHVHMLVETEGRRELSRGMQGLCVRLARRLNRHWGRRGSIFHDRFHEHVLRTPSEVRNALVYVLQNGRKHRIPLEGAFDPYSTAAMFDDWAEDIPLECLPDEGPPCAEPRTWLLRVGWRRYGPISIEEEPRKRVRPS